VFVLTKQFLLQVWMNEEAHKNRHDAMMMVIYCVKTGSDVSWQLNNYFKSRSGHAHRG
jgi:hypothetical protein